MDNSSGHGSSGSDQMMSIAEAAAECGMSVDELIGHMVRDGMLIEHPEGGYIPSPHPDIRPRGIR